MNKGVAESQRNQPGQDGSRYSNRLHLTEAYCNFDDKNTVDKSDGFVQKLFTIIHGYQPARINCSDK